MEFTYFEAVMAFFGLASVVIGSFADRLINEMLRGRQAASARQQTRQLMRTSQQFEQNHRW
jgi:hypothetical protein